MAQRHVMTARRKAALRKAQLASAKKRRRNARRVAVGAVGVAAAGTAAYHMRYANLYHNTGHHRARMITKNGFQKPTQRATQMKYGQLNGPVSSYVMQNTYMTTRKRGVARMYGADTVKIRVRRSELKTLGQMGHFQPGKAKPNGKISRYSRHERYLAIPTGNLGGRKVKHVRVTRQKRLRKNGVYPLF